jgi:DNA polymerase-3 subunit alpha (Gram-positive type)
MESTIQNIVVFDIETTGLVAEKNAIIELACCSFDNNLNDLKEYDSGIMKIYDNREVQKAALDANGITMEQIENGRDAFLVINELINYFKSLKKGKNKPILAGQNSDKFDIPFLVNFFEVFNKDLTDYVNVDFTFDTMWLGRVKYTESINYKLITLCEKEGIQLINAHRAVNDARATKDLLKTYIRCLRQQGVTQINKEIEVRFRETFQF